MFENVLLCVLFNLVVKKYWLVSWLIVLFFIVIGIFLFILFIFIFLFISGKMLNVMLVMFIECKLVVKCGILFKVEKFILFEKIIDVVMS